MFYYWLLAIILLVIIEVVTVNLTTIWFVASGILALIISFFTDNLLIQMGVFVIGGVILLATTRSTLIKLLDNKKAKTNLDRIIGMQGIVISDIKKDSYGEVKVDGKIWIAYADEKLVKNSKVVVLEINSTKLKVRGVK